MTTQDRINRAKRAARRVYNCQYFGFSGYTEAVRKFDAIGIYGYWQNMETDDVTTSERRAESWIRRGDYVKYYAIDGRV